MSGCSLVCTAGCRDHYDTVWHSAGHSAAVSDLEIVYMHDVKLFVFLLQVYIQVHWRIGVVEQQFQLVNTSLWMNVLLVKLWTFIPLNLATAWSTILTLIHLCVLGMTVQYQLMYQSGCVMEVVPVVSVKRFSSIHRAQLYVISAEMETSSESELHASTVRISLMCSVFIS